MASNYAEKFKNDYQFLKKYGFVFSRDPFNDERPCYKNRYGEIILWTQSGSVYGAELYIQMNGRKQVINPKEEYESIFNEKPTFLPINKIFEKIFEYHVKEYGRFHDLYIIKNDPSFICDNEEADTESFSAERNPLNTAFMRYLNTGLCVLLFAALFLFGISKAVKAQNVIDIFRTAALCSLILSSICIALIIKGLPLSAKILLIVSPAAFILPIYLFATRVDYIIYFVILTVNFIYATYYLIKNSAKENLKSRLGTSIFMVTVPFIIGLFKTIELNTRLFFFKDTAIVPALVIGAIVSALITLGFAMINKTSEKIKSEHSKKEEIGKVIAVLSLSIALLSFLPYFTIKNANYAFDTSEGVDTAFVIIDKSTRHGGKGGQNYSFTLSKDGINESVSVDKATYQKYDIGDTIHTRLHSGALGMEYYEYAE